MSTILGAMPFYFSRTLENPLDAIFESMSGFTTTGVSVFNAKAFDKNGIEIPIIVTDPYVPEKSYTYYGTINPVRNLLTNEIIYSGTEAVSKGILFWRSFTQWLGGMGIVVLFIAILPALAIGGKFLFEAEVPGPTKDTIVPRIRETSSILWKLYVGLTLLEVLLLIWTHPSMPLLDAFCITFSTLSTGGFSVTNESIGSYNNPATEWVVIVFMILGSINFALYFFILRKKFYRLKEPDLFLHLLIVFGGCLLVSCYLFGQTNLELNGTSSPFTVSSAIREGVFQAVSAQTCTGFSTTNYNFWPFPAQLTLLLLMYLGGMSGSTSGGVKTSRIMILYKVISHRIENMFKPDVVRKLRIGNKEIIPSISVSVLTFFTMIVLFTILGTFLLVFCGIDPQTSISSVASMLNNVGLGFRAAGPTSSFAFFTAGAKIVSIFLMLFGRLEFFVMLLLFIPGFWKNK